MQDASTAAQLLRPRTVRTEQTSQISPCKLYKIRWMILFLFLLYAIISNLQWIQYSIIADDLVRYYGVSYIAADWTSTIFSLVYLLFSFPGCYLLDKLGLRISVLVGIIGTCAGAWIKVASIAPNRYWVLLIGQTVVSIFQVLVLPVPPVLAAIWFGPSEVSSACSIGICGIQFGVAFGFVIPPILIKNPESKENIEHGLYTLALVNAVASSATLLILFAFFEDKPDTPPSPAQMLKNEASSINIVKSVKQLAVNFSFILLLIAYGICIGIFYAVSTLLSQIVLKYYPDAAKDAGGIGLTMFLVGIVGSVICGVLLDNYRRFKETIVTMHLLLVLTMCTFTFTLNKGIELVYLTAAALGMLMTAVTTGGLELGAELTYPVSENMSAGILTSATQLFAILMTYSYSRIFYQFGDIWANVAMSSLLLLALILIASIRYDLRRQAAQVM